MACDDCAGPPDPRPPIEQLRAKLAELDGCPTRGSCILHRDAVVDAARLVAAQPTLIWPTGPVLVV
jgi:hypothetical protein